jgi:hypothetical protein
LVKRPIRMVRMIFWGFGSVVKKGQKEKKTSK